MRRFLIENFGGYTAAAGNIFGYWTGPDGRESYGEHRQFLVAVDEATGGSVSVVWAQR